MPGLIERLSRSGAEVVRPFFACVLVGMKRGGSLETAWKAAVEELHPAAQVRELLLELHLDGDEETVVAQLRHAAQNTALLPVPFFLHALTSPNSMRKFPLACLSRRMNRPRPA